MQLVWIFTQYISASHNSISFCALLTSWSTVCHCHQLCGKIQKSSLARTKYIHPNVFNSFHRTVIHGRVLEDFLKPIPLKRCFPTFHHSSSSFCYRTIFLDWKTQNYWKVHSYYPLLENDPGPPDLNSELLFVRPSV